MRITDEIVSESIYAKRAGELFEEGYNCSQSVVLAFADKLCLDQKTLAKISASFGGGMGRLREVCGTVTGMFVIAGILYGYESPEDYEGKKEHYARVQLLAEEFKLQSGSIICRDLLGLGAGKDSPIPEKRTKEYYEKRPCKGKVCLAAAIMEQYILEKERDEKNGDH